MTDHEETIQEVKEALDKQDENIKAIEEAAKKLEQKPQSEPKE